MSPGSVWRLQTCIYCILYIPVYIAGGDPRAHQAASTWSWRTCCPAHCRLVEACTQLVSQIFWPIRSRLQSYAQWQSVQAEIRPCNEHHHPNASPGTDTLLEESMLLTYSAASLECAALQCTAEWHSNVRNGCTLQPGVVMWKP